MKENEKLIMHTLSDIKNLKVHGRNIGYLSPLTLFWTGSGIELNASGSELWIEVEVDYDVYEPWINIVINSVSVSRQMLISGRYWICVFRGMDVNTIKNVRIIKETQAMNEDPGCYLQIHGVKCDGEFMPVLERPYKFEFIGDSITSGEGVIGAKVEEDWIPMWFSSFHNYSSITAQILNADYRIISQSGWGVLTGWDNNPHCNIPEYYNKVCGLITGKKNESLGAFEENNFDLWQPDVVVVNLGTNDVGAFNSPEWKDEVTGVSYKQKLNEDGTFDQNDLEAFEESVCNFLGKIRRYNKKANIIWVYGMLGIPMLPSIYRAVDTYVKNTSDKKVFVFQLPNTTEDTIGARSHPGILSHEKAAKELAGYIKEILLK